MYIQHHSYLYQKGPDRECFTVKPHLCDELLIVLPRSPRSLQGRSSLVHKALDLILR